MHKHQFIYILRASSIPLVSTQNSSGIAGHAKKLVRKHLSHRFRNHSKISSSYPFSFNHMSILASGMKKMVLVKHRCIFWLVSIGGMNSHSSCYIVLSLAPFCGTRMMFMVRITFSSAFVV